MAASPRSACISWFHIDGQGVIGIFNVGTERMRYTAIAVIDRITPADIRIRRKIDRQGPDGRAQHSHHAALRGAGLEKLRWLENIYGLAYIRKDGSRIPSVVPVTAVRGEERIRAAWWDGYIANPFTMWRSS